jgi:hypothetical protein
LQRVFTKRTIIIIMQFTALLSLAVVCLCAAVSVDAKKKEYKLSSKRIEAGKYARRCEKEEMSALVVDEEEIKDVAEYLLKNNAPSVWIGGVRGIEYEGSFVLNVDAKKKGKYGSHTYTLVPTDKSKHFTQEYFALCRRASEE